MQYLNSAAWFNKNDKDMKKLKNISIAVVSIISAIVLFAVLIGIISFVWYENPITLMSNNWFIRVLFVLSAIAAVGLGGSIYENRN